MSCPQATTGINGAAKSSTVLYVMCERGTTLKTSVVGEQTCRIAGGLVCGCCRHGTEVPLATAVSLSATWRQFKRPAAPRHKRIGGNDGLVSWCIIHVPHMDHTWNMRCSARRRVSSPLTPPEVSVRKVPILPGVRETEQTPLLLETRDSIITINLSLIHI